MLVGILMGLTLLQLIRVCHKNKREITIKKVMAYVSPYWLRGDGEDRLLGIMQLFFIACISFFKASKMLCMEDALFIFILTFISFVWLVKLLVGILEWVQNAINLITPDVIFTLLVPFLIFLNVDSIDGRMAIKVCLMALFMSLCVVYMELARMIIRATEFRRIKESGKLKLKSIWMWLVIVLMNLYTLLTFIQFYWDDKSYHFIEAKVFNQETAVDLLYYLIVTFTTVGLGDIQPHTEIAKMVTILIALSGMFFTGIFVSVVLSIEGKKEE